MELLQRAHIDLAPLQSGNSIGSRARGGKRGDSRDAGGHRGAPDGFFVEKRIRPVRSIEYKLNTVAFDQVDHVRAAFFYLEHALASHAGILQRVSSSVSSHDLESEIKEALSDPHDVWLVAIGDADENSP